MTHMFRTSTMLITFLALSTGCGGGGGGGGGGDPQPPVAEVSGTWSITETLGSNTCGESGSDSYSLTVSTNGNSVTVQSPAGTFTGLIDGDRLEWSGSYPEDGGTTTLTDMDLTVSADGNSISGTTSWRWSDGSFSCSGTTTVSGVRTSPPPGGGGGGGGNSESEPNNRFQDADTIAGGSVTGAVNTAGDEFDWFTFTAPTGGVYDVRLVWSSVQSDLDLGVSTAGGDCVSDAVGTTSEACTGIALSGGESILILVHGYDTSATQTYTLTVQ